MKKVVLVEDSATGHSAIYVDGWLQEFAVAFRMDAIAEYCGVDPCIVRFVELTNGDCIESWPAELSVLLESTKVVRRIPE